MQQQLRETRLQKEQDQVDENKTMWMATGGITVIAMASLIYIGSFYLPDNLMASAQNALGQSAGSKLDDANIRKYDGQKRSDKPPVLVKKANSGNNMAVAMTGRSCAKQAPGNWDAHADRLKKMGKHAKEFSDNGNPFAAIRMIATMRSAGNMQNMAGMMCDIANLDK